MFKYLLALTGAVIGAVLVLVFLYLGSLVMKGIKKGLGKVLHGQQKEN